MFRLFLKSSASIEANVKRQNLFKAAAHFTQNMLISIKELNETDY